MPGPVPDPESRRSQGRAAKSDRPTPGYRQLRPYTGEVPEWPWPDSKAAHRELWRKLWRLPQANEWRRLQCEELVALYVRAFCYATSEDLNPKLLAEVRQLDGKIGLSPQAMRGLGWEILEDRDEPREAKKTKPLRAFVPRSTSAAG